MILQCLLGSLESRFCISARLKQKFASETDPDKLNAWFQLPLKVTSLEEFEENI